MRNLKRVLSLALACVMVIGMMVMTTGAADFDDAAEIEYVEAVEVMAALGVLEGYEDGSFNPDGILTREQAAKIIAYMLLGDNAEKLNANNTVFTDVEAGRWSAGYISYCTSLGILAGNGDGTFNPEGKLTGIAFGKMLLVALGYDAKIEGYVGTDWATNIATDMIGAGIDVKGVTLTAPLTREQAAQMAFQTLEADMVDYLNRGWEMTLENGQTIVMGASKAEAEGDGDYKNYGPAYQNGTLQFCEKYFDDLTLDTNTPDVFGNPGYTWLLKNKEIVICEYEPSVVITKKTMAPVVANMLKGYTFTDDKGNTNSADDTTYKVNNSTVYGAVTLTTDAALINNTTYDGVVSTSNITLGADQTVAGYLSGLTGNGKVVKIYADRYDDIYKITTTTYGVADVKNVSVNKDGDVSYTLDGLGASLVDYADEAKFDDLVIDGELKRGDVAIYIFDDIYDVYYIYAATKFTGVQSAFNAGEKTITVDGTTYNVANTMFDEETGATIAMASFPNDLDEAEFYTDAYGNVVKSNAIDKVDYAVINAIAKISSLTDSVQAELVFADGTTKVVTVAKLVDETGAEVNLSGISASATDNAVYKNVVYDYDVKGDKYELTAIKNNDGSAAVQTLNTAKAVELGKPNVGTIVTDDNTVFVVRTVMGPNVKYSVYTGYKTIPNIDAAAGNEVYVDYAIARGSVAFVYVDASNAAAVNNNSDKQDVVYITSADCTTVQVNPVTKIYQYKAVINGEKGTLTTIGAGMNTLTKGLYKVTTVDKDGYVVHVQQQIAAGTSYKLYNILNAGTTTDAKNGVIKINGDVYTYNGSETVYVIDKKGDVSETTVSALDLKTNVADYGQVYVKEVLDNATTTNIHEIDTIYVTLK